MGKERNPGKAGRIIGFPDLSATIDGISSGHSLQFGLRRKVQHFHIVANALTEAGLVDPGVEAFDMGA